MPLSTTLAPLPDVLALPLTALVGRLLLSLAPPGDPGSRPGSELPGVWAASLALGGAALDLERALSHGLGWDAGPWTLLLPWLAVALLRSLTLPAAVVPRHAPAESGAGALGDGLRVGTWVVLGIGLVLHGLRPVVQGAAGLALALEGLRVLRVAPAARAATALVGALLLVGWLAADPFPADLGQMLLLGGAVSLGGLLWVRRADRRGRALALLAPALAAGADARCTTFALAALGALLLVTPRPRLAATARLVLAALLLAGAGRLAAREAPLVWSAGADETHALLLVLVVVTPVALVRGWSSRGARREVLWLVLLGLLPLLLGLEGPVGWVVADALPEGFGSSQARAWNLFLLPLAVALAGLGFLPLDPEARRDPRVSGAFERGLGPRVPAHLAAPGGGDGA